MSGLKESAYPAAMISKLGLIVHKYCQSDLVPAKYQRLIEWEHLIRSASAVPEPATQLYTLSPS